MSRKDKPYLPLYVQDFMTDEKLIECSAQTHGVYIRLMCILHKQEQYGKLLLKQNDKQTTNQIKNFATKLSRQMPFTTEVIFDSLSELKLNNVIQFDGDFLSQKRMVDDGILSEKRSVSGCVGGKRTQELAKAKDEANIQATGEANSDIEIDSELPKKEKEKFDFYQDFDSIKIPEQDIAKFRQECGEFLSTHLRVQKMKSPMTAVEFFKLMKKYSLKDLKDVLDNMENSADLHKKYTSAYLTANNWLNRRVK